MGPFRTPSRGEGPLLIFLLPPILWGTKSCASKKGKGGGEGRKIRISDNDDGGQQTNADKFLYALPFDLSAFFTGIEVVYVRALALF